MAIKPFFIRNKLKNNGHFIFNAKIQKQDRFLNVKLGLQLGVLIFALSQIPLAAAYEMEIIQPAQISSWNHTQHFENEFVDLSSPAEKYDVNVLQQADNVEISATLIKKIANWHHQHSNGVKVIFLNKDITFSKLSSIDFHLKSIPELSIIPNKLQLKTLYQSQIAKQLIDPAWFNQQLNEHGVINITLFGEHNDSPEINTTIASYQLVLNKDHRSGEAISLPLRRFSLYQQKDWQETQVTLNDIMDKAVVGMLITAETVNGKTLRSYLQENFEESMPESFIELAIKIQNLAIILSSVR